MPRPILLCCSMAAVLAASCGSALAAPSDLDPTFGSNGIVLDPMNGNDAQARALAIDASGRIVVAGIASGFLVGRAQPLAGMTGGGVLQVMIDDVLTTGATAEACARVLMQAGARAVDLAVIARVRTAREPPK